MIGYPSWFTKNKITVTILLCFFTGIVLVPTLIEMRFGQVMPWRLEGLPRLISVSAHVFLGFVLIGILGALLSIHVPRNLQRPRGRVSGLVLVFTLLVLALTGVALLYVGHEGLLGASSVVHTILGIIFAGAYGWHLAK